MATAELVVAFSAKLEGLEASLKRVTGRLDELEGSAKKSVAAVEKTVSATNSSFTGIIRNIRSTIALFAVWQTLRVSRDLVLFVDDLNSSLLRLQFQLGNSRVMAEQVFGQLAEISKRTGAPINDLASQYARFNVALAATGASSGEINKILESLSNFGRVSGVGTQEMSNAITQLTQGLASGKLQGDELKSIMENFPLLAQALARELGVSTGELRKLGEEGKLTVDRILPALLRVGDSIKDQLKNIPLNITQSFQGLETAWGQLIGYIDRTVSASSGIAALLRVITAGTDATRRALGGATLAEQIEANKALEERLTAEASAERGRLAALRAGTRPDAASPLAGRGAAPGMVSSNTNVISPREIATAEASARQLEERLTAVRIEGLTLRRERDEAAEGDAGRRYAAGVENRVSLARAANRAQLQDLDEVYKIEERARERRREAERIASIGELTDRTGRVIALSDRIREINEDEAKELRELREREGRDGVTAANRAAQQRLQIERQTQEGIAAIRRLDNNPLRNYQEQINELFNAAPGSRVGSAVDVFVKQIQERTESAESLFGALGSAARTAGQDMVRSGRDPGPIFQALEQQLDRITERLRAVGVPEEELNRLRAQTVGLFNSEMDKLREKAESTFMDIGARAAKTFSSDLAGEIVDFATTGSAKFDEMAANFAKNVAKMILEFLILRAIVTGLKAGFGISLPGFNMEGRMAGGPVRGGTPYIVGEKRPEVFVPGSSGYVFPRVEGGGGSTTVNVYNSSSASIRTNESTDGQGNKQIEMFIEEAVRKGLATGRFDASMRQNYGIGRPGRV